MKKGFLLCFLLFVAFAAFSQGIRIVEPPDGAVVKGEVPIRIEGAERGYAYITLDGEFLTALNLPSDFKWDTQAPYGFRSTPVKDGEHILAVKVVDGTELIGQAQVKITVKNKIDFPVGEVIKLAYLYKEGEEHSWKTKASREGLELELQWKELCNEVLQPKDLPPVLLLTHRVENGRLIYQRQTVAPYPDIGSYFFLSIFPNGEKADIRALLRPTPLGGISTRVAPPKLFGWGQLRLIFPDTGVKLGQDWRSSLLFVADIESGEPQIAVGTHKIEDVVWVKGYKCIKIRSTFEWQGEISTGGQVGAGAGMMPGMMMPGAMGPGGMMPGMMMPGAMGPGGMMTPGSMMPGGMGAGGMMPGIMGSSMAQQPSAAQRQAAQPTPPSGSAVSQGAGAIPGMVGAMAGRAVGRIPVNVEGTRISYFAFEEGKIVRIEDEIRVRPRIGREREGEATLERGTPSGMMPGMMGPGAMGPGAMPGGMMPGMMGPGAMGPGAMPGGMMPGMMGPGAMGPGAMPAGMMPGMMGPGAMGPGAMPAGMMPGMMGPGAMGPGAMPAGMMPGMMGPGAMGPGAMPGGMMGAEGTGMTAFAGGAPATPAGRAMGPFMAGPTAAAFTTAYTLKVISEMTK